MKKDELDYLRESNNIEDEWDDQSLQDAILAWQYLKSKKKITIPILLQAHSLLMNNRILETKYKGEFRDCPVWIGGREGKPWYAIPELITQWIFNANDLVLHGKFESPIFLERMLKEHHVRFETIHPFVDGNGRIGRLTMLWQRIKLKLPIVVILEKEKNNYYKWFE